MLAESIWVGGLYGLLVMFGPPLIVYGALALIAFVAVRSKRGRATQDRSEAEAPAERIAA
ncbi:MAG: hypothetical protein HY658_13195 [Actinobacteria bacterium]|nr:hypothetical protein [Actinomycetota bacterium]